MRARELTRRGGFRMANGWKFLKGLREIEVGGGDELMKKGALLGWKKRDMVIRLWRGLECGDGVHYLSVQASAYHYCEPRKTVNKGKYKKFEVALCCRGVDDVDMVDAGTFFCGGCAGLVERLKEYAVGKIYPYVPGELVEELYCESLKMYDRGGVK